MGFTCNPNLTQVRSQRPYKISMTGGGIGVRMTGGGFKITACLLDFQPAKGAPFKLRARSNSSDPHLLFIHRLGAQRQQPPFLKMARDGGMAGRVRIVRDHHNRFLVVSIQPAEDIQNFFR